MKVIVVSLLLSLSPALASAEIVAWVDNEGVHHYTNVPDDIPEFYRDTIQTVVKEPPRRPEESAPAAPRRRKDHERERPRMAQVVYDRAPVSEDYVRGFVEGVVYGRGHGQGDVDIDITGPLAVADARAASYVPSYPCYDDGYPLVTTAFDRGRSRHLTLRMLLQDQFQLDRGSPYLYEARFLSPRLGVDLNPFHPRGLPRGFPRETRVIRR
jgi:hypothetical protein